MLTWRVAMVSPLVAALLLVLGTGEGPSVGVRSGCGNEGHELIEKQVETMSEIQQVINQKHPEASRSNQKQPEEPQAITTTLYLIVQFQLIHQGRQTQH